MEKAQAIAETFEELNVPYPALKDKQKEAIEAVLDGQDVFASLPTGYGKTIITAMLPRSFD